MRIRPYRAFLLLLLLLGLPASGIADTAPTSEVSQRSEVTDQGRNLLLSGKIAELEALYARLVIDSARTSSGLWKSQLLLGGVYDMFVFQPQTDADWDRLESISEAWAKQSPDSAMARLVHAEVLIRRAWNRRGGGYASEVPESAWAPFKATLQRAQDYLDREEAVVSGDPEYYAMRIRIAKGLGDDAPSRVAAWFEQGVRRHPAYYPLYFDMVDYLLPKWHGDAAAVEAFAWDAVSRTHATEGEGMYARIYWYVAQSEFGNNLFLESRVDWQEMKAGFDDVVARYPAEWNIQHYAKFACLAGDMESYRRERNAMQAAPVAGAWGSDGLFARCESLAGNRVL